MDISNRIKRDIDIYNGVTPANNISPPSSFNIFTLSNLRIVLIILLIIFIIFYLYNANFSINDYKPIIDNIINYIKKIWTDFITFIKSGKLNNTNNSNKTTSQPSLTNTNQNNNNTLQDIPQNKKALDAIKTALDTNSSKYIATIEETNNNTDEIPGWCYIGKDSFGAGVCAQTTNESLCASNLFYQKEEKCINQTDT